MNKIMLALAILLLIACAPTKQTLRSEAQLEQSKDELAQSNVTRSEQLNEYWSNLARELQERNVKIVHTIYDTSQPVDSITGKPPIASEMILTDNSRVSSSLDSQSAVKLISEMDSTVVTSAKTDTTVDVTQKTTEKQGSSTAWVWLIAILTTAIAVLLLWRKFR